MKKVTPPSPGGVPGGASWLTKSSLTAAARAASSSAGKISSKTLRAVAVTSVVPVVTVMWPSSMRGRLVGGAPSILMPVAFSPMSENTRPRRRYDAPRRREQAALTRRKIVEAAEREFLEQGYAAATSRGSRGGGVAVETVYRSAGGKADLLAAGVQAALAGGTGRAAVPVEERPAIRRVIEETDARRQLRAYAATQPGVWARSGPLLASPGRRGARQDPALVRLVDEHAAQRRTGSKGSRTGCSPSGAHCGPA